MSDVSELVKHLNEWAPSSGLFREAAEALTRLERERDEARTRLALFESVRAEDEAAMRAGDWVYQQERNAEWASQGELNPEQDVSSTALYRGNSVGWIYTKAENYKKALGRVWDTLRKYGIQPDGKTHCADAADAAIANVQEENTRLRALLKQAEEALGLSEHYLRGATLNNRTAHEEAALNLVSAALAAIRGK